MMSIAPSDRMICFECYEVYLYNSLIHCNVSYVGCFIFSCFILKKLDVYQCMWTEHCLFAPFVLINW